jgi:DNA-binding NarL/FixJ family response regulator
MQFVFSRQAPPDNLTKESAPDELVKAIRQISQGKKYISPSLAEKLALV